MKLSGLFAVLCLSSTTCHGFTGLLSPLGVRRTRIESGVKRRSSSIAPTRPATVMAATSEKGAAGVGNLKSWDPSAQQAFIKPAVHNKNPVRVAALLTAAGFAARGSLSVPGNLAKFVHILSYAAWTGSTVWVTFVAGITMFRNLPRQAFGKLQAKLFPAYFQMHFAAIGAMFIVRGCPLRTRAGITLLASLISTFLNMVLLEPTATEVMFKRYKLEDDKKQESDEYKELGKKFGQFHGASSLANLGALIGAFVYSWDMASMFTL